MFSSPKYSFLVLRIGLAAVFLWFGMDKIINPEQWFDIWVNPRIAGLVGHAALSGSQSVYLCGVFEILVGVGLAAGMFTKLFSVLATLFLIGATILADSGGAAIKNIGLTGGLLAIFLWPVDRNRF